MKHVMVMSFVISAAAIGILPWANSGAFYGFATVFQFAGKTLGGAFAFPFVVYGSHPAYLVVGTAIFAAVLFSLAIPAWKKMSSF